MTDNNDKLNKLISELEKDNIVYFVGAGLSRGSGLPDWEELIFKLCDMFSIDTLSSNEIEPNNPNKGRILQETANIIEERVDNNEITLALKRIFDETRPDTSVQEKFIDTFIGSGGILFTTNYDDLLENAARKKGINVVIYSYPNLFQSIGANWDKVIKREKKQKTLHIFKMHGSISDGNGTIILSAKKYEEAYRDTVISLLTELSKLNILFVGCSFTDSYFGTQYRKNYLGNGNWFAFYPKTESIKEFTNNLIISERIIPIYYSVNDIKSNEEHKDKLYQYFEYIIDKQGFPRPKAIKSLHDIELVKNDRRIKIVEISDELSNEDWSFKGIKHLRKVVFSDNYTGEIIPNNAFYKCISLEEIHLPKGIKNIGNSAFEECLSLVRICIDDCINKLSNIESIGERVFYSCRSLQDSLVFDETCTFTKMPKSSFENCIKLMRVELHHSIIAIGESCFCDCENLYTINIRQLSQLTEIRQKAFFRCSSLLTVLFPDSLERLGEAAFQECTGLVTVLFPRRLKRIEKFVFCSCTKLQILGNTEYGELEHIYSHAFQHCTELRTIHFPNTLYTIAHDAFIGCKSLADVYFSPKTKKLKIANDAFANCYSLTNISKRSIEQYQK